MTAQASGREIDESHHSLVALCLVGEGEEDDDDLHIQELDEPPLTLYLTENYTASCCFHSVGFRNPVKIINEDLSDNYCMAKNKRKFKQVCNLVSRSPQPPISILRKAIIHFLFPYLTKSSDNGRNSSLTILLRLNSGLLDFKDQLSFNFLFQKTFSYKMFVCF